MPQVVSLLAAKPTPRRANDRPPIFTLDSAVSPSIGRSNWDQAASAPDALATWVAIASIKAGERQS
jgi:hypothetical protein